MLAQLLCQYHVVRVRLPALCQGWLVGGRDDLLHAVNRPEGFVDVPSLACVQFRTERALVIFDLRPRLLELVLPDEGVLVQVIESL